MSLHSEILEQPEVIERLFQRQSANVKQIADAIRKANPSFVFLAARGTSDNAGRYANYLWGSFNQLPVALATPSLFTLYQKPPRLQNALVVGISQSGQSPDIVSVIREGKKQGNLTLAITNMPESPLAKEADFVLDICAGEEKAVAATKTYTSELAAIAMLAAELRQDGALRSEIERVPGWAAEVLKLDEKIRELSLRYAFMQRCVVLGRGYNYATAFEWSLKMKELTYTIAEPYSSADFQHGPIALVETGFPVMAAVPGGEVIDSMLPLLRQLKEQHADLSIISDRQELLDLAQSPIPLPAGIPEWLSPIVGIIPAQLFCYHLTRHKGFNTEAPRTIHKVTETQ